MLLEIKNLYKNFGKDKVIKDVSLKIDKNEIVSIIGPSGSGKSTLLRCINRIEIPTRGKIFFDGNLITSKNINEIRKDIGMVFQSFNLFSNLTVIENIVLAPIKLKILSEKEAYSRAYNMLKEIDLYDKKDDYPDMLSGGQKQRVAIIRTLLMNPKLILLDEPTSALDPEMTKDVTSLIKKLKTNNITLVIVSHEMEFVKNFASRIIFFEDGKVVVDDTYDNIMKSDNSRVKNFINDIEK